MSKAYNLTDQRFGRLVAIRRNGNRGARALWLCQCDCGGFHKATTSQLVGGRCKSCGCYKLERSAEAHTTHGHKRGGRATATYATWSSMKQRCDNPNNESYPRYGGRGISYSREWTKFERFLKDMGECPEKMTLERLDTDGDYSKANCIWASRKAQARNRRENRMLEYQGESRCLARWASRFGLSQSALFSRLKRGWSVKKSLEIPLRQMRQSEKLDVSYKGESKPLKEWAEILGLPYGTLWHRIRHREWSIVRAFETPVNDHQSVIQFRGKSQNLAAWARELGLPYHALYLRLKRYGWSVDKAFLTPVTCTASAS